MFNDDSDVSVENVGCPTTDSLDASKLLSYAVSDVSYESASPQVHSASTLSTSFSAFKRRSTLRQKCASALVNVCTASRRAVSNVTCHSGRKDFGDKDALPQFQPLKTTPDVFWNSALRTMVKPAPLDWSFDQYHLAKIAVQSVRTVQELGAYHTYGDYVRRDLLGRHVRDLPRFYDQEECVKNSNDLVAADATKGQIQTDPSFKQQRSKSTIETLSSTSDKPTSKNSICAYDYRKSECRTSAYPRFKFWSEQTQKSNKVQRERRAKLGRFPKLQWKGYRHESDCESDSLDSDSQTPYDSIRPTVNADPPAANAEKDDRMPDTADDNNNKTEGMNCQVPSRSYSRQISKRKVSLVRAPTGESLGIVSCESGPLPAWLEEAVWEVETTGSEILTY